MNALMIGLAVLALGILASAGETVAGGSWTKKSNAVAGSWSIEKSGDTHTLNLKGFKTKGAPDLKLFLSKQVGSKVTGKNATQNAVRIAVLKSPKGDQAYVLPAGIDPSDYKTLILHCQKYSKTWSVGAL